MHCTMPFPTNLKFLKSWVWAGIEPAVRCFSLKKNIPLNVWLVTCKFWKSLQNKYHSFLFLHSFLRIFVFEPRKLRHGKIVTFFKRMKSMSPSIYDFFKKRYFFYPHLNLPLAHLFCLSRFCQIIAKKKDSKCLSGRF